jgi:hypothetical protein
VQVFEFYKVDNLIFNLIYFTNKNEGCKKTVLLPLSLKILLNYRSNGSDPVPPKKVIPGGLKQKQEVI